MRTLRSTTAFEGANTLVDINTHGLSYKPLGQNNKGHIFVSKYRRQSRAMQTFRVAGG